MTDQREVSQPTPDVSPADVERIVARDFAGDSVDSARAILNEYGAGEAERAVDRVRLAVLKLANGDIERLRSEVANARRDFRDVIAAAEYPKYCRHVSPSTTIPAEERQRIIDSDWAQYQRWLGSAS